MDQLAYDLLVLYQTEIFDSPSPGPEERTTDLTSKVQKIAIDDDIIEKSALK